MKRILCWLGFHDKTLYRRAMSDDSEGFTITYHDKTTELVYAGLIEIFVCRDCYQLFAKK